MVQNKIHINRIITKLLAVSFAWLFLCVSVAAQVKLYTNLEHNGLLDFSDSTQLYIDSTDKLEPQQIPLQEFRPLNSFQLPKSFISGYKYSYWLKFEVENPTNDTLDILFSSGLHLRTSLYESKLNFLKEIGEANEALRKKDRSFKSDDQYILLRLLPKSTYHFYARIKDYPRENFEIKPIFISKTTENLKKLNAFYDEYIYLVTNGCLIAVLLFVALFVLLFYFLDRQPYYLYYAFYTISIALFNLWEYEHSPYNHLIFKHLPNLKFTGNSNIYVLLTHIFYFLFIFEFLELKKRFPLLAKIFSWVIITLASILLADIIILFVFKRLDWSTRIFWIFQDTLPVLNLTLLFTIFRIKGRIARYIKIGSTFLMLGGLAGFLSNELQNPPMILFRVEPSLLFTLGILIEVFFFSIAIGMKSYQIQKEQKSLQKSIMESELRTLRSQINPHFVFNSLNSIKSYILTHRSTEASEYLTDFSTLMRSILQYSKEQLITLTNELEIAILYISLEKRRFEENFVFNYEIEPSINTDEILIPPMLLQPYIENAIKHGLMNKDGIRIITLKVSIENSKTIKIEIDDNGIGRENASLLRKNTPKYQSLGMSINDERVDLLKKISELFIDIQIIDKQQPNGLSAGTNVTVRIPIE